MISEIMPDVLKARLEANESIVILDVRQPEEHAEKNIPGAILIPLGELPMRMGELDAYKGKELVVYCRSGNRSGQACMLLQMSGFANPVNLRGGMLAW
jgi:rhodanese-related sulfurtransferase